MPNFVTIFIKTNNSYIPSPICRKAICFIQGSYTSIGRNYSGKYSIACHYICYNRLSLLISTGYRRAPDRTSPHETTIDSIIFSDQCIGIPNVREWNFIGESCRKITCCYPNISIFIDRIHFGMVKRFTSINLINPFQIRSQRIIKFFGINRIASGSLTTTLFSRFNRERKFPCLL